MNIDDKKKIYPKTPLGIIALFFFLIEAISTISLKFMLDNKSEFVPHFVWFIMLFSTFIAIMFFVMLWFKREVLYSPADFRNDEYFVRLIDNVKKQVETIEVRQQASLVNPRGSFEEIFKMIQKLVEVNEFGTAINLAKALLKVERFQSCLECFQYLAKEIPESNEHYVEAKANIAYCYIGLKEYKSSVKQLQDVQYRKGEGNLSIWEAAGLAYSNLKVEDFSNYRRWLQLAKEKPDYANNVEALIKLYPEIKEDLKMVHE